MGPILRKNRIFVNTFIYILTLAWTVFNLVQLVTYSLFYFIFLVLPLKKTRYKSGAAFVLKIVRLNKE